MELPLPAPDRRVDLAAELRMMVASERASQYLLAEAMDVTPSATRPALTIWKKSFCARKSANCSRRGWPAAGRPVRCNRLSEPRTRSGATTLAHAAPGRSTRSAAARMPDSLCSHSPASEPGFSFFEYNANFRGLKH